MMDPVRAKPATRPLDQLRALEIRIEALPAGDRNCGNQQSRRAIESRADLHLSSSRRDPSRVLRSANSVSAPKGSRPPPGPKLLPEEPRGITL